MSKYRFDKRLGRGTGRYVDSRGRIVSNKVVRAELDTLLDNAQSPMDSLFDLLRDGNVSLVDFRQQGMRIIKNVHLNAVAMQRGGWANMTQADYGRAGQKIREQYGYWNNRVDEIASGKQRVDGSLKLRMNQYVQAGRETFNASEAAYATSHGATYIRSILNPADHCSQCVALNGKWFEIGSGGWVPIGSRTCRKNCKCRQEHGRMDTDGEIRPISDSASAEAIEVFV